MTARILVAGVGNIFLGDDGFGVEVARRLHGTDLGEDVRVADYGIAGMHLAYDLLAGFDSTIFVDATQRGDRPGTVYVVELDPAGEPAGIGPMDAHGMQPDAVLSLLRMLGGESGRVLLVGCEPAALNEHIGLSGPVASAVGTGVDTVIRLVASERDRIAAADGETARSVAGQGRNQTRKKPQERRVTW